MQLENSPSNDHAPVHKASVLVAWPLMVSRTVHLSGRQARLRLETEVWSGLDEVSRREGRPVADLCRDLDGTRDRSTPLATAIRSFVLGYFRRATAG